MTASPRGRARCRGHEVEVLDERADGASQIRFLDGIARGTTICVISDEIEYPGDPQPVDKSVDDVVCRCSDAEKEGSMTVPDDELGMYVCGVCGKPSRLALAKAAAQSGLVW